MSRKFSSIDEVHGPKETWRLAVRITNLWLNDSNPRQPQLEMVFMDAKGDKITAVVNKDGITKWESILKEGSSYDVQNFLPKPSDGKWRSSPHDYKFQFYSATSVKENDHPEIPPNIYRLTSFEDIITKVHDYDYLVDVIGEYVQIQYKEQQKDPHRVQLLMKDKGGNTISWTLWEGFAGKVFDFFSNHQGGPVVILLTLAKIKDTQGKFPLTIQNTKSASKLFINDDINEIREFIDSLDHSSETYSQTMTQLSASSQSHVSLYSQLSDDERFLRGAQILSLREIKSIINQDAHCLTIAEIDHIFPAPRWSYESCHYCTKGVPNDRKGKDFKCKGCERNNDDSLLRFKVHVKVKQFEDTATFIMWDRDCTKLLGTTAFELKKLQEQDGDFEETSIPEALDELLGRVIAFKIKVKPYNNQYSVNQISEKQEMIEMISSKIPLYQDAIDVHKENLSVSPNKSISGSTEYDPTSIGVITPAKRLGADPHSDGIHGEQLTPFQCSSSKHIKSE